jgi:predicted nucleotidyltransferase
MENALQTPQPVWAVTPEKINEVIRRIIAVANPVSIILFGSCGRGEHGPNSDVDILVVEREVPDRYAEAVRLNRALRGMLLAVDVLVIGEHELAAWSQVPGSVYRTAQLEGKVVYAAA